MLLYLRAIDWKVLVLGFLGCYVLPALVVGTLLIAISDHTGAIPNWGALAVLLVAIIFPPLAAGYFAARFAKTLPQLHALALGLLGLLPYWFSARQLSATQFGVVAIFILGCNALGAFVWLRSKRI